MPLFAICSSSGSRSVIVADLLLVEQDERLVEDGLHLLGVGDEVRRQVAAVEPHALRRPRRSSRCPSPLRPTSCPSAPTCSSASATSLADRRVVVRRDGGDLHALLVVGDRPRQLLQRARRPPRGRGRARASGRSRSRRPRCSARPRRRSPRPAASRWWCRRRRARRCARRPARMHLRAEVLLVVLELELLGDGHAVVADDRPAPLLLDEHALRLRAERDADGVGERQRAVQDLFAGGGLNEQMFVRHDTLPFAPRRVRYGLSARLPNYRRIGGLKEPRERPV